MSPLPPASSSSSSSSPAGVTVVRSTTADKSKQWQLELNNKRLKKMEDFFNRDSYKEYVENAIAFNRKLNEERKMRIPYIDGQTGVAQRHYNAALRHRRERMPPRHACQIVSYPQRQWRKKRYQYLKFFLQPKKFGIGGAGSIDESEMHTISQIENPGLNEDSNHSGSKDGLKEDWYYDDEFGEEDRDEPASDSDYDEDYGSSKKKKGKGGKNKGGKSSKSNSAASTPAKRRTHADSIPDSEKPFSCELCGMRYKTRPGLSYHYSHSHKDYVRGSGGGGGGFDRDEAAAPSEDASAPSSLGGTPPSTPDHHQAEATPGRAASRRSTTQGVSYREEPLAAAQPRDDYEPPTVLVNPGIVKTMAGRDRAKPNAYCDFCLGDSSDNKKTGRPEELVSCAECGRSGHPSCLQFSENMLASVRQYPWQCIECKCCSVCGTSENDDQLLFCDDCDRGYHMYCLVPPIKEPPEGSWSCKVCIERFHRKN